MKLYEVTTVCEGDMIEEFLFYFGTDFEAAKEAKKRLIDMNDGHLTAREKEVQHVEARIWEVSDDLDLSDDDAVTDAICECGGYDTF